MLHHLIRLACLMLFLISGALRSSGQDRITDSLWDRFNQLPKDSSSVNIMLKDILWLRQNLKNSPEEEKMLLSALSLAEGVKYKHGMAECYNLLGVFYRETSRYIDAISFHEKALKIVEKTHDSITLAYALNNIGVAYRRIDENQKAFQYHYQALAIAKAIGNDRNRSIAMNSIANIYLAIGDYNNAIEEFEQCLALEKQMNNDIGLAINYANIGAAYEGLEKLDTAIIYYKESLKYNSLEKSDKGIAISYNLLGKAFLQKGDYMTALFYLRQALSYNDRLRDRINVAENYITIGKLYQKTKSYKASLDALQQGLNIAGKIGSQSLQIEAHEAISETQQLLGNTVGAYDALRNAYQVKDNLFKEQTTPQMAKMRTLYELDKKEDQIRLLQQSNEINQLKLKNRLYLFIASVVFLGLFIAGTLFYTHYRKQKNYKLRLQYELQSLRSQMNPHFIFNAMNSIDNFIWKNQREEASAYLVKFSSLMRMTLLNSRSESIPLPDEIEFLNLYLELESFRYNNKFNYQIDVAPEIEPNITLVPSMIIQPFVENAVLHGLSHKEGPDCTLSVRFLKENNLIVCEVEDNGIGRRKAKELQKNGLAPRQSFGIRLTKERVNLLKKITGNRELQVKIIDLEGDDSHKTGTLVRIKLPLNA